MKSKLLILICVLSYSCIQGQSIFEQKKYVQSIGQDSRTVYEKFRDSQFSYPIRFVHGTYGEWIRMDRGDDIWEFFYDDDDIVREVVLLTNNRDTIYKWCDAFSVKLSVPMNKEVMYYGERYNLRVSYSKGYYLTIKRLSQSIKSLYD